MRYWNLITSLCLVGTSAFVREPANAADDATTICKAAVSAYEVGIASGDPVKLASTDLRTANLCRP